MNLENHEKCDYFFPIGLFQQLYEIIFLCESFLQFLMNGYNYFYSIYPVGNKGTILYLGKNSKCWSIFSMPKKPSQNKNHLCKNPVCHCQQV